MHHAHLIYWNLWEMVADRCVQILTHLTACLSPDSPPGVWMKHFTAAWVCVCVLLCASVCERKKQENMVKPWTEPAEKVSDSEQWAVRMVLERMFAGRLITHLLATWGDDNKWLLLYMWPSVCHETSKVHTVLYVVLTVTVGKCQGGIFFLKLIPLNSPQCL